MGKGGSRAPTPPDAYKTAQQHSKFNQINQSSPFGSVTYTGTPGEADRKQTTTLDPKFQKLLDQNVFLQGNLLHQGIGTLNEIPKSNINFRGLPELKDQYGGLKPQQATQRDTDLGQFKTSYSVFQL